MGKYKDITGHKFGRLTVLKELKERKNGKYFCECICDCGNVVTVRKDMLKSGNTKSCGCLQKEKAVIIGKNKRTHGKANSRIYRIYYHILNRCYRKSDVRYEDWGGRGIIVCDEWRNNFVAFYEWSVKHGYKEGLQIDRIDNDGNYEPNNCRWATAKENSNNRRSCLFLTYNGKTQTITQWANELNCKYNTMVVRYHAGWSTKEILFGKERK